MHGGAVVSCAMQLHMRWHLMEAHALSSSRICHCSELPRLRLPTHIRLTARLALAAFFPLHELLDGTACFHESLVCNESWGGTGQDYSYHSALSFEILTLHQAMLVLIFDSTIGIYDKEMVEAVQGHLTTEGGLCPNVEKGSSESCKHASESAESVPKVSKNPKNNKAPICLWTCAQTGNKTLSKLLFECRIESWISQILVIILSNRCRDHQLSLRFESPVNLA